MAREGRRSGLPRNRKEISKPQRCAIHSGVTGSLGMVSTVSWLCLQRLIGWFCLLVHKRTVSKIDDVLVNEMFISWENLLNL